jgi:tetratricopeptide (TPR) repeat protein
MLHPFPSAMRFVLCHALLLTSGLQVIAQAPSPSTSITQQETEALMAEILILFQAGSYPQVLEKLKTVKASINNRPIPQVLFIEGASHFNLGDYDKAIPVLEEFIKNFAEDENASAVRMVLGRSHINKGEADQGISILKDVVNHSPEMKAEAGLYVAEALKKQDKLDEALAVLGSVLDGGIRSAESVQAAMMAAELHVANGALDAATALMEQVKGYATGGENAAQMNNIYLRLGDQMMEKKSFREALGAYQFVRRKNEISRMQQEVIAKIEQSLASPGKGPVKGTKEELEAKLKANQELLAEIAMRTDYDASLYYRLGHCYFEMGRHWESLLAFEVIVNELPTFSQRDRSMFGMIIANAQLKRVKSARQLCERYIQEFPDGADLGTVSEMYGMLAYENGRLQEAADAFNKAEGFPKADRERLRYLRGNVLFELQRFDDARTTFELLVNEFPKSNYKDDSLYRVALIYFYQNDSVNSIKALNNYMKENPEGQYVVDARYRLAFIKFQSREVDTAIADLLAILKDSPDDPNIGQVHALLGDAFNQKAEYEKALEHFALGVERARTEEVLTYAMDQVTDLYAGSARWKELGDMWQKYLDTHKNNEEQELKAVLWISRARVKENQVDAAKTLLAQAIRSRIGNPANQQVEGLIQQLVTLSVPKRQRPPTADPKASELTQEEVAVQLEQLLNPPESARNGASQMRILFAKSWLAKAMREPVQAEKLFSIIVDVAEPEDLSPMLLATVGDNARRKGDLEKAAGCYNRLNEFYKDSEYADGAAVGLAEIAYMKGDYEQAMQLFNAAIEGYAGSSRLLDATLGRAKTLFQLKKHDEAKALYLQILNTKEWRGEAHAMALFMQGEIEFANLNWGEAIPYYQRVFIAHQKWKSVMAQAYLQCARAFLKLNRSADPTATPPRPYTDRESAKLTLLEMLKRADLKDLPEITAAEKELSKL